MAQKDLFKRGESIFYTPIMGTSDIAPKDVKARIDWSNTPKRLNTFFFGPEVLKLIRISTTGKEKQLEPSKENWNKLKQEYKQKGNEIYLVSVKRPTSGYSEAALLSVVGKVSQLTGASKKNDLVYDYPETVRKTYWKTVSKVMQNFRNLQKRNKLPNVFAKLKPYLTGHHGRELSNYPPYEKHPGIRTVILHHDHLVFVDESRIKPQNWNDAMFNLDKEYKLFWSKKRPNLPEFVSKLNTDSRLSKIGIKLRLRRNRPTGYEAKINYDGRSIAKLEKFLQAHFSVYSDLAKKTKLFVNSPLIQPIFTFYLIPKDTKQALVIFMPNVYSIGNRVAGGPERAGILMRRRPDVAPVITEDENIRFGKLLTK